MTANQSSLNSKEAGKRVQKLSESADNIATATGQAFYVWDIASDKIEWSRDFEALFDLSEDETRHLTGRGFESLLSADSHETRFGVIVSRENAHNDKTAVPYQCIYLFHPNTEDCSKSIWIEDTGHWFPDADGRPLWAEGSVRIINERRKREEELRRKSDFDDLTGLPNRRTLENLLQKTIAQNEREGLISTFLILSLDRMDAINDIYGFETGDIVLKKCGEIIRTKLRTNDFICRFSGAKFGIILNECKPAEIYDAANRLLKALSADIIEAPTGYVAVSGAIGACFIPQHADNPSMAIHAAFQAARKAKFETSTKIAVYANSKEEIAKNNDKAIFSGQIVEAVNEGRVKLAYQPVVEKNGSVAFHEALIRLERKNGEIIEADQFVSVIEELGLVRLVDQHALGLVLKTLNNHHEAIVSVNVSQESVLDPDWLSKLASGLLTIENGSERLIIEITESMAVTDLTESRSFIDNIHTLGCRVAIDDFGAGFTSFSNLKNLPVDIIKIDGSFGIELSKNQENQVFIKALLDLAKAFNIKTVVEWVEDEDTSNMLLEMDVDYQQGYRFGKAMLTPPWPKVSSIKKTDCEANSNIAS